MIPKNDEQLIIDCQEGNDDAFRALVERWRKPLLAFLLRLAPNRDDAMELFQETFTNAFRNMGNLKDPGRFASWLFAIAMNCFRMRNRVERRFPREILPNGGSDGSSEGASAIDRLADPETPEEMLSRAEMEAVVKMALAKVDPRCREVILLKEYAQLKFVEIAQTLNVPLSTVKSRLYIGLDNLKREIGKIVRAKV